MIPAGRRALVLAGLRPALPVFKATSTVALVTTSRRPLARSVVGAGLVACYASAATFHILAGDRPADAAPATLLALLAASLV